MDKQHKFKVSNTSLEAFFYFCPKIKKTPMQNTENIFILDKTNSIASQFIAELRDIHVQTDRMRFRRNMERLGEILAYEVSKSFPYEPIDVQTPLGIDRSMRIAESPVLITIMRAGLPLYQGFLNYFDRADSGFIGAYRKKGNKDEVEIAMHYVAANNIDGRNVILIDPMLATGSSLVRAYQGLLKNGNPAQIHIVAAIASVPGVEYIAQNVPDCKFWLGALDPELDDRFYIIPGLGDAGDLSYGPKI